MTLADICIPPARIGTYSLRTLAVCVTYSDSRGAGSLFCCYVLHLQAPLRSKRLCCDMISHDVGCCLQSPWRSVWMCTSIDPVEWYSTSYASLHLQ